MFGLFKKPYYHFVAEIIEDEELAYVVDGVVQFDMHLKNSGTDFYTELREYIRTEADVSANEQVSIIRLQRL